MAMGNLTTGITHRAAIWLAAASAVINSPSGLVVRSLEAATDWQAAFWRGLSLAVALVMIMIFEHRSKTIVEMRRMGWLGVAGGLFFGGALLGYVISMTHTTVANTVFTMSAIPFFTAIIAFFVLGERVGLITVMAILCAAAGVALMVGDGFATGSLFGNLMAIMAAICFASFVVVLRKGRSLNMLPATIVGAMFSALVAYSMTGGEVLLSAHDLALCLLWGAVISGSSFFLVVLSSRYILGAELALLVLLEFILAPIWVWLFVNEVPGQMTLIGGAVVLFAVGGHALMSMREQR